MLAMLRVSGFALVDEVEVRFGPGLNVLTGETGAGKSVLLEALHLALGGRMSASALREGADEAVVEALFELPPGHPVLGRLEAAGLLQGDPGGELLVRRVASRGGRGRAFVNGALCTVGMLESALRGLADMTGQHEHMALLDESTHLGILDAFAGQVSAAAYPLECYREAFGALSKALRERAALAAAREERARRADYLEYQLREIESLEPRPGEDVELEQERQVLSSVEKLRDAARRAEALVYGEEGSAAERVGLAVRALGEAAALDGRLAGPIALLRSALAELEDSGRALAHYADVGGGDPDRLASVEERLDGLRALARKHGGSLQAALERAQAMRSELENLAGNGERLEQLEREVDLAGARSLESARALTRAREEGGRALAREVGRALGRLGMERCSIEVALVPPEDALEHQGVALGPHGAETARIMIAPNPGEGARPLARSASGGELSRVLLAMKRALVRGDLAATYVFDEVDAGVGGAIAEAVGRVLCEVSRGRQVICVTHLPQVAAFADVHLLVQKRVRAGRTATAVVPLATPGERRAEVARMLAGVTVTDSALEHAGALLAAAGDGPADAQEAAEPIPSQAALVDPSARGRSEPAHPRREGSERGSGARCPGAARVPGEPGHWRALHAVPESERGEGARSASTRAARESERGAGPGAPRPPPRRLVARH
jgi:DNA repair protein RecN (Recombination protein N)